MRIMGVRGVGRAGGEGSMGAVVTVNTYREWSGGVRNTAGRVEEGE